MEEPEIPEWLKYIPEPEEQKQERLRLYEEKYQVRILALSKKIDLMFDAGNN